MSEISIDCRYLFSCYFENVLFSSWFGGEADGWQCAEVGGRRRLSSLYSQEDKRPETGEVREGEEETKERGSTREGHPQ